MGNKKLKKNVYKFLRCFTQNKKNYLLMSYFLLNFSHKLKFSVI